MDHDELVEMLKNLDSDMVATDLEKMDPESLAQLLAMYKAADADKSGAETKGHAKALPDVAKPDQVLSVVTVPLISRPVVSSKGYAKVALSDVAKAYAKDSNVARDYAKDSKYYGYRSGIC